MLPLCKYGTGCYRKNPDHLKHFSHIIPEDTKARDKSELQEPGAKKAKIEEKKEGSIEKECESELKADTLEDGAKQFEESLADGEVVIIPEIKSRNDYKRFMKQAFLVEMPLDFYHFWEMVVDLKKSLKTDNPMKSLQTVLVGPFDVIGGKFKANELKSKDSLLCYCRYPTDPPEFQTAIITPKFRYGYWRDDPGSGDAIVVSIENQVHHFPKFSIVGDNMFAAFKSILDSQPDSIKQLESYKLLTERMQLQCKSHAYSIDSYTEKIKSRKKKIVAPTLHGIGVVVPVENEVGYRPLGETNAWFKKTLTTVGTTKDDGIREALMEKLQETFNYVQFANDEMDYGMGLEFAHDLLISGYAEVNKLIANLLPIAYSLLDRGAFEEISKCHLKTRFDREHMKILTRSFE